jgi:hypothetical protein
MRTKDTIVVKIQRPHCRTPIKPLQTHKSSVQYNRRPKHPKKVNPYE